MIILIDMDNTLAEFEQAFLDEWRRRYPSEFFVPLEKRRHFHAVDDYPEDYREKIYDLYHSKGFIRNLPAVEGGIPAVKAMVATGHDVRLCSSHMFRYDHCVLEKYQWVEAHLGAPFVDRLILARDKTLIRGDVLIDDKPMISGITTPMWEHILYDRPYNQGITDKRRLTWLNWREVLFPGLEKS